MADLQKLVVRLEAQNTKYLKALDKSQAETKRFRDKVNKQNQSISTSYKAIGIGVAAATAAIKVWYSNVATSIDVQAKQARELGLTVEQLEAYRLQAELNGSSSAKLEAALRKLNRGIGEAQQGFGTARVQLEALGLANEKFFSLNPGQQFEIVAERISKLESNSQKAAAAAGIFGRAGQELLLTFQGGAAGFAKAAQDIESIGASISTIDAAKVEAANDAFTRTSKLSEGLSKQLAVQFAPIVQRIGDELFNTAKEAGGLGNIAENTFNGIVKAAGFAANAIRVLEIGFKTIRAAILTIADGWIQVVGLVVEKAVELANFLGADLVNPDEITSSFTGAFSEAATAARAEVEALVNEPLPAAGLEAFVNESVELATEQARLTSEIRLATYTEALDNEVAIFQASEDAKTQAQIEAQKKREAFEKLSARQKTATIIGEAVKLTQGVAQESKTLFRINKAAAIANAIVNTAQSVTATLAAYPFPFNVALAALSAAAGVAQINAIRSTQFGGGGGGTTPSSAGTTPIINDTPVSGGNSTDISGLGAQPQNITIAFDSEITDTQAVRNFIEGAFSDALGDGVEIRAVNA